MIAHFQSVTFAGEISRAPTFSPAGREREKKEKKPISVVVIIIIVVVVGGGEPPCRMLRVASCDSRDKSRDGTPRTAPTARQSIRSALIKPQQRTLNELDQALQTTDACGGHL